MPIGDYGIYNSKQASVLKTKSLVMSKTLQITTEKPTLEDNVLTSITNSENSHKITRSTHQSQTTGSQLGQGPTIIPESPKQTNKARQKVRTSIFKEPDNVPKLNNTIKSPDKKRSKVSKG